jgi:hypothetical protein
MWGWAARLDAETRLRFAWTTCPGGFAYGLSPIPDDGPLTVRGKDYETLLGPETRRSQLEGTKEDSKDWHELLAAYGTLVTLAGLLYE